MSSQPVGKCKFILIVSSLSTVVACSPPVVESDPPRPTPTTAMPTEMDLLCAEAIEQMRELVEKGARTVSYLDPKGQLASLVETCAKEGKGDRPAIPTTPACPPSLYGLPLC